MRMLKLVKRLLAGLLGITLVITIIAFTIIVTPGRYFYVVRIPVSLVFFERTLEGLEERAYSIVRGILADDARTIYTTRNRTSPDPLHTLVTFTVSEVFKGDIEPGAVVRIIEPYFISGGILYTVHNYMPSRANQEYIFFLGNMTTDLSPEESRGAHFVVHLERGRYLVPSNPYRAARSFTRRELSLGDYCTELYYTLYEDVLDAFVRGR